MPIEKYVCLRCGWTGEGSSIDRENFGPESVLDHYARDHNQASIAVDIDYRIEVAMRT